MLVELILLLLTTVIAFYLYSYKRIQWYFKQRDVNFLPGWPLFGNILASTFFKKHFIEEMDHVYKAFPDDKYVGFQDMTTPIIMIRDPEIMKNIVIKDFDHFTDHKEFFSVDLDPLFGGSLFLMKGDRWRQMRLTLSPAFTGSKMKYMFPFINRITNNIVEYLDEHQDEDIDVDDLMRRYTNDVIASAGFGYEVNSLRDRDNEFFMAGNGIFDFSVKQQLILMLTAQFPKLGKKLGLRLFSNKVYSFFSNLVASTLKHRTKEKIDRPDMIQLLMEAKKGWTPEDLTSQIFIFFTAGYETSASALVMTIHEMAINPDIEEKLYQECKKFSEKKELTFDTVGELEYLDAVFNETLRKWCPAILLDRVCTKTYELPPTREGAKPYVLKPGDIVYNAINQIQMDSNYWPMPDTYNPDRFLDINKDKVTPYTYMPFGVGPRACIGMRFAMLELKILMFNLILNFKIIKAAKTSDDIRLQPTGFLIKAAGGTAVQFKRRI